MSPLDYVTVDVFTRTRFAGNPLAVIPDARGLTDSQMQSIAAEFNYSESTFVLPPADAANTARVRIFTPTDELPFAGHPNVGTGFVLGRQAELFGRTRCLALRGTGRAGRYRAHPRSRTGRRGADRGAAPARYRACPRCGDDRR